MKEREISLAPAPHGIHKFFRRASVFEFFEDRVPGIGPDGELWVIEAGVSRCVVLFNF